MNPFKVRKPRRFNHPLIYSDERRERLREMEDNARRELGLLPPKEFQPADLRGAFQRQARHVRRRQERQSRGSRRLSASLLLLMIVALLLLMHYLMSGHWFI